MARVIRALPGGPRVIAADVFDAHVRAQTLLAQAQRRADTIEASARARGLAQGNAEAAAGLIDAATARDAALATARDEVLRVAAAVAQHIVGETMAAEPQRIGGLVAAQLARVRSASIVRLRVHPEDEPALRSALAAAAQGAVAGLELSVDETLARGGCVVDSDVGGIDARVEARIDALIEALRRAPT